MIEPVPPELHQVAPILELSAEQLELKPGDRVSWTIVIERADTMTVLVDGQEKQVTTVSGRTDLIPATVQRILELDKCAEIYCDKWPSQPVVVPLRQLQRLLEEGSSDVPDSQR